MFADSPPVTLVATMIAHNRILVAKSPVKIVKILNIMVAHIDNCHYPSDGQVPGGVK